jgi:hypothetical protein
MDDRLPHYLRKTTTARMPRRHVIAHATGIALRTEQGHRLVWGAARAYFLAAEKGRRPRATSKGYESPHDLWADVAGHTRPRARTVLWAHDLAAFLRLTDAMACLTRGGWRCEAHNLAPRGTWLIWRRDGATLTMVDTASVWPTTLATVGKAIGCGARADRSTGDPRDDARRINDDHHGILSQAVTAYLDWLDSGQLGPWQLTGAGQSMAAFKAGHLTHRMLVHCDLSALAAERRAMWTGRCEAYFRGRVKATRVQEWDLRTAYLRVAASTKVPTQLIGPIPPHVDWERLLDNDDYAILAYVDVDTRRPVVPATIGNNVAWPVGTFSTTLWGNEIREAITAGAGVRLRHGWIYHSRPALQAWARWALALLDADDGVVSPLRKLTLRHHGRACVGRFAMNYESWDTFGRLPSADLRQTRFWDMTEQAEHLTVQIGRDVWVNGPRVESDSSLPQVTGWVMAETRCRLWRILQALPPRAALYVDTDSVLVDGRHHDAMAALAATELGDGLALKHEWRGVEILGPRQLLLGPTLRVAGAPRNAVRRPDGVLVGEAWESLRKSLERGSRAGIAVTSRTFTPRGTDHRRLPGPDGWTQPIEVGQE